MAFRASLCLAAFVCLGLSAAPTPVILISIDTLRADHLGAYGYRRIATPNIDSFAGHGTLFTSIDSQIPLTLPSHTSLFTSAYPFEDRIEENAEPVGPGAVTLASVLKRQGYQTAAFLGCVFLERQMGLDQGFDVYDSPFQFEALSPLSGSMFFGANQNPYAVKDRRDGALVLRAATQWLAQNPNRPVFAFVHLFDLHQPYKLEAEAQRRGISGYDAEIEYVDRLLGAFKKTLVEQGWWDRALVVLLADHGEGLGQHGESAHGYFIYESTLWVPLVLHWPSGAANYPPRASQPAALIDVAPTILDFLRVPAPPSFRGKSLVGSLAAGGQASSEVYSETLHTYDSFGWSPLRGLRAGAYKYIDAPRQELYNLQADPHELINLAAKEPAKAQALRGQLMQLLARYAPQHPSPPSRPPSETRALQSLGYLSGGPHTRLEGPRPDPKDRLPEFHQYESAQAALAGGRRATAISMLRQLLAQDPGNTLARRDLGSAYLDQGDYANARVSLQQVLSAAPDDYVTHFELGLADENLKLFPEALEHLETACRIAPDARQCRNALDALKQKMK